MNCLNLKYVVLIVGALSCLVMAFIVYRKIITVPAFREWMKGSFSDEKTGKASGKKITAFMLCKAVFIATIMAVVYSPNHILPDSFLIAILTFIAALYGINYALQRNNTTTDAQLQNAAPPAAPPQTNTNENQPPA